MNHVETSLLFLHDDHTYWPARTSFLKSLIAPFEDPKTGGVSPVLEARHRQHPVSWTGFWTFLGMTYLARRRFEYCGTYGIDGVGPFNADDDKFHTRWLVDHGWKIKLQASPESTLTTELGHWPKFTEQCLRWTRTTWRSNSRQLLTNYKSWVHHPYTTLTLFLWFFRASLVHELSMLYLLHAAMKEAGMLDHYMAAACALLVWIITMKYIKISATHFKKHPYDIAYFPAYLLFGYWWLGDVDMLERIMGDCK
ncbi:hypothetical protein CC86DRAFT_435481, partial [Ophiobolus disseminans]